MSDRDGWIRWLLNNDEEPSQLYEDLAAIMKADAETIAAKDAELALMREALETYEDALSEAEAIFGGEYADHYGPMFELAMKARDARAALQASKPANEKGQA
ncbi:MAG: hypothetical protein WDN46_10060 [Methylocella sp.]